MRIAMVSEHASPLAALGRVDAGGQNVHVAELAAAMARAGHEVTVYTRREDPDTPHRVPFLSGAVVEHVEAGPPEPVFRDDLFPYMDAFAWHLSEAWARHRPDVVHAHFWMSGHASLAAARPMEIPLVQTFHALGVVKRRHQGDKDTSPPCRLEIEERLVREADRIVATCSDEVFELVRLGAERRRTTVVPCGVDLRRFRPDGPAEPRERGRARIVVVSRLVERKGIGNVIAALPSLPDAELIVAGGPEARGLSHDPEAVRLQSLARRFEVEDRVELRGRVERDRVPALLRSADVVVCAPWYEPFGMVAVEAQACGVPVVATAAGGLVDTVVHGATGLHVLPRDTEALAEAIGRLLRDPELRARLGKEGVRRTHPRYGWPRIAAATADVYAEVREAAVAGRGRAVIR